MVRHCAVGGCLNTDLTMLCHRFPRRMELFHKWRRALDLDHLDDEELHKRAVVCTFHFKQSDYRNPQSRMLNTVAVPSLTLYKKGPFYDTPTSTAGKSMADTVFESSHRREIPMGAPIPKIEQAVRMTVERLDSAVERVQEQEEEVFDVIQPIEVLEDEEEDCVYYIEEQDDDVPGDTIEEPTEVSSKVKNETDSTPDEPPPAKRKKSESDVYPVEALDEEETEQQQKPSQSTAYRNAAMQTDEVRFLSSEEQLQLRMADEFYPAYASLSRLELIKQLKEKDDRLADMTKKLENIEMAHAAMMKTMEAFKSIMK